MLLELFYIDYLFWIQLFTKYIIINKMAKTNKLFIQRGILSEKKSGTIDGIIITKNNVIYQKKAKTKKRK